MIPGIPTPFADAGLADLVLLPLGPTEAEAMLDARTPDLDPTVRERVLTEAAGSPSH